MNGLPDPRGGGSPAPASPLEPPDATEQRDPAPVTGHPTVDAALRELDGVAADPPAAQLPGFHSAHRTLRETLASIDEEG